MKEYPMYYVCHQLQESSAYVNNWISKQPNVKEESLSDWLLFDISSRLKRIYYRTFTRHEEARHSGADWEWWFLFPHHSIRFRVQAKKIFDHDNYPEIARTNQYGLQIDKFLEDSKNANAIPLYAFFSKSGRKSMCKNTTSHDGVYIAGGHKIYNSFIAPARNHVNAEDILNISNPFSCFGCCPVSHEDGLKSYLNHYYPDESSSSENNITPGIHYETPQYVTSLIGHSKEERLNWWYEEFNNSTIQFRSLLIYDFRDVIEDSIDIPYRI